MQTFLVRQTKLSRQQLINQDKQEVISFQKNIKRNLKRN